MTTTRKPTAKMKSNFNLPPGCLPEDIDQKDLLFELEKEQGYQDDKRDIEKGDNETLH